MNIFIDDTRSAPKDWIRFTSAENFIKALPHLPYPVQHISFDHDLGEPRYHQSGYDLIKYLVDNRAKFFEQVGTIYIHSSNVVGRKNMMSYLASAQQHNIITSKVYIYPTYLRAENNHLYEELSGVRII